MDKAAVQDRTEWIFQVALDLIRYNDYFYILAAKDKILFVYNMKIYEDTVSGFEGVASGK